MRSSRVIIIRDPSKLQNDNNIEKKNTEKTFGFPPKSPKEIFLSRPRTLAQFSMSRAKVSAENVPTKTELCQPKKIHNKYEIKK